MKKRTVITTEKREVWIISEQQPHQAAPEETRDGETRGQGEAGHEVPASPLISESDYLLRLLEETNEDVTQSEKNEE